MSYQWNCKRLLIGKLGSKSLGAQLWAVHNLTWAPWGNLVVEHFMEDTGCHHSTSLEKGTSLMRADPLTVYLQHPPGIPWCPKKILNLQGWYLLICFWRASLQASLTTMKIQSLAAWQEQLDTVGIASNNCTSASLDISKTVRKYGKISLKNTNFPSSRDDTNRKKRISPGGNVRKAMAHVCQGAKRRKIGTSPWTKIAKEIS